MGNPTIGLVNLPEAEQLLAARGLTVVTGASFPEASRNIRTHVRATGMDTGLVLLIGDSAEAPATATSWLRGLAARTRAVVVNLDGAIGLGPVATDGLGVALDAPVPWAVVLEALVGSAEGAAAATVEANGSITVQASSAPGAPGAFGSAAAEEDDPWASDFDFDELPSAGAEIYSGSSALTTDPAGQDDDPWASPEATGLPAPVEPIYTGEVAQSPAPPFGAGVADVPAGEVEDDLEDFEFDTPAVSERSPAPSPAQWAPTVPTPIPAPLPQDDASPVGPPPVRAPLPLHNTSTTDTQPSTPGASVPGEPEDEFEALLGTITAPTFQPDTPVTDSRRLGHVIICSARKGGVSKSTTSTVLAQYAGEHGPDGMRVGLIDFNIGQADIRGFLSLTRAPIPTLMDVARGTTAAGALVNPTALNEYRAGRAPLTFGLLAGAPNTITADEAALITPALMLDTVRQLRTELDLIIIDTEAIDEPDTSGHWGGVFLPLIREGAWLLMLSDSSTESVRNTSDWLGHHQRDNALTRDRVMFVFNRVSIGSVEAINTIATKWETFGRHIGTIAEDETVDYTQKSGQVPSELPAYAPVAAAVLRHATGLSEFDPAPTAAPERGWLSRILNRGGRK